MPFRRRHAVRALIAAALCLLVAACAGMGPMGALLGGNRIGFSAAQLQTHLDRRFPRDYSQLGGLVTLSVLHPRLRIPAQGTRLQLEFDVAVATLGRPSRVPAGHFNVSSGLRYDPNQRGLMLDDPRVETMDIGGLGTFAGPQARDLLNRWLRDYAAAEPVYRFDDALLARLGQRRIVATTIDKGHVVVELATGTER